ncbi:MAG: hypothetical protein V7L01_07790 [Nostoc sp.]|uniref:hypothetical protein n=1 Tax=Nostoc sp. TaxID=1180 RepID=UPI002FF69414
MNKKNGTTQAVGRRLEVSQRENEPGRLAALRDNSSIYGVDQIGIAPLDSSGEDKPGAIIREKSDSGKILERLELIEKTFLFYVQEQQKLFETRLEESKGTENLFKAEVQALKQEIYGLVSTETEIEQSL